MPNTKAPAKMVGAPKKTRQPKSLSGAQQDALQAARDQKLTSVTQALKDGKIDHGDAASPTRGVLDPAEFDKFEIENRPTMNETQRLSKVICEHLNEHHNPTGEYEWTIGFFVPEDPRANGGDGFKTLTTEAIGEAWSTQLQAELGLTIFNGALCWNGRGTFERHIICVKTKQLQERQILAKEESMQQQFRQPESVAGERMNRLKITEKVKKLPVMPVKEDGNSNDGGTINAD